MADRIFPFLRLLPVIRHGNTLSPCADYKAIIARPPLLDTERLFVKKSDKEK